MTALVIFTGSCYHHSLCLAVQRQPFKIFNHGIPTTIRAAAAASSWRRVRPASAASVRPTSSSTVRPVPAAAVAAVLWPASPPAAVAWPRSAVGCHVEHEHLGWCAAAHDPVALRSALHLGTAPAARLPVVRSSTGPTAAASALRWCILFAAPTSCAGCLQPGPTSGPAAASLPAVRFSPAAASTASVR